MALAALPSQALADEPGSNGWRGRAASAQGQARNDGEPRANSGQSQAERARGRAAVPSQAVQQHRERQEQRPDRGNAPANWRTRVTNDQTPPASRAERPRVREGYGIGRRGDAPVNRVTNNPPPPEQVRRDIPQPSNGVEQRRIRAEQERNRQDALRAENARNRDRNNGWNSNRYDPPRRYETVRTNPQRWDDDRRWSYSNGRYQWNRNWRNDRRYDWRGYRTQYRYIYSPGYYYAPYRSYYYRPMLVGSYLDTGFYGTRYWLSDPWEYRLPMAYGPYRWIRYFDDALLVNIHTGMVADTIRNFFW